MLKHSHKKAERKKTEKEEEKKLKLLGKWTKDETGSRKKAHEKLKWEKWVRGLWKAQFLRSLTTNVIKDLQSFYLVIDG